MSHAIQTKPSYEEAIQSLSTLIPELLGVPGIPRRKFSLDEIRILSAALGNPHMKFPSVLVAGTNGKGSTSATLASIARASGLRVGLYTSPHLARVNERIRILDNAGAPGLDSETRGSGDIPDQTFADLYFRVLEAARRQVATGRLDTLPSFFEHLTALAFLYFAEERVDLAVLEVGMGGRLDATNLVDPILSVITDISLDHQEWLGSTIALIAREKAGILRRDGTLITLPQHPEANQAIGEAAVALNVRGVSAAEYTPQLLADPTAPYPIQVLGAEILVDSPLKGAHQHRNTALAIAAAVELAESHNFPITPASIQRGIQTTHWPGRLERIALNPELLASLKDRNPELPVSLKDGNSELLASSKDGNSELVASSKDGNPELPVSLKGRGFSRAIEAQKDRGALAPEGTEFILDVAHNPAGAWALRAALNASTPQNPGTPPGAPHLASEMRERSQCLIFACLRDKPLREMAQILFPIFDHVILAPIHSPRATDLADLLAAAESTGTPSTSASTVAEAIQLSLALHPARIVVSGSVYLVGEARTLLLNPKAPSRD